MKRFFLVCVMLLLVPCASFAKPKHKVPSMNATLLALKTPEMNGAVAMIIFYGDGRASVLYVKSSVLDMDPCPNLQCDRIASELQDLVGKCALQSTCADRQGVYQYGYYNDMSSTAHFDLNIQFSDGQHAYFPSVKAEAAREVSARFLPPGSVSVPTDASKWVERIQFLDEQAKEQQAEAERQAEWKQRNDVYIASMKLIACLRHLEIGSPAGAVYACGSPDHTNSDMYVDQLVYPDGTMVYIDKKAGKVQNVQWSH